jgi:DegV family protein with EDD domain
MPQLAREHPGCRIVPLTVRFGDEELRDYVDLTPERFYQRLQSSPVLPRTSQPSPQAFSAVYADLLTHAGCRHVVSLHVSGALSGTVQAARLAAAAWEGRVTVLDGRLASAGTALCARRVLAQLDAGTTREAVVAYVEGFAARCRLVFSVDTLEYLERGGRIGRAQALVGGLLNVRPILGLADGVVAPLGRVRGASRVLGAFRDQLVAGSPAAGPLRVAVAHACAPQGADGIVAMVRETRPEATVELVTTLGAVIGTYAGPGALGLAWVAEPGPDAGGA